MGKWCLLASSFILDRVIFKVSGNHLDRHKSSVEFDFGPNQTAQYGVTCPWVTKISHFWTLISLKPVGQSWSYFMFSIIVVGERLHKVLVGWLCWGLTSQSTIFQSYRDGAIASWVINQYFRGVHKVLGQIDLSTLDSGEQSLPFGLLV